MGTRTQRSRFARRASGPSNEEIARSVFRANVGHAQFPEATQPVKDIVRLHDPRNFLRTSQVATATRGIRYGYTLGSPTFSSPPGLWYKFWRFAYLASLISATILFLLSLKETPKGITFKNKDEWVAGSHGVGEPAHSWVSKFFENGRTSGSPEPEVATVVVVKTPEPEVTIPARKRWFGLGNEHTSEAQPTQPSPALPTSNVKEVIKSVINRFDVREWDLNVKRHVLGQTKPTKEVQTNTDTWNLNVKQFLASRAAVAKEKETAGQKTLSTERPIFTSADVAILKSESYTTKLASIDSETEPNNFHAPASKNEIFPRLVNVALSLYEPILDHEPLVALAAKVRVAREVFHRAQQTLQGRNATLRLANKVHKLEFKSLENALGDYRFLGQIHADQVFSENPNKILRMIDTFQKSVAKARTPTKELQAHHELLGRYKWELFNSYYSHAQQWLYKLSRAEEAVSRLSKYTSSATLLIHTNFDIEASSRQGKDLSDWLVAAQARKTAQLSLIVWIEVLCQSAENSLATARERVQAVLEGKAEDQARFASKRETELGVVRDVEEQRDLVTLLKQKTEKRFRVADQALRDIVANKGKNIKDDPALA